MSPLWHLKYVPTSTSGRISVLAAAVILVGTLDFESPAWAGRDKPPVATKDLAVTEAGDKVKIKVLANDFDPDGTKVRLKRVGKASKGKIKKSKDGTITYTPDESAEGKDRFRYVIKDRNGKGKKAKGRVVVNILRESDPGGGADNDPPVADAGPNRSVTVGQSITLDGSGSFDPNDDPLTYSWSLVSWPTGSTADFSNSAKKKPVFVADIAGTFIAELMVYDGIIRSTADRVEIAAAAGTPPPPPGQSMVELCADPSVLRCIDFDSGLNHDFMNTAGNPLPPAHDPALAYEGDGSLKLTIDAARGFGVTGDVGYDFPLVSSGTFYVSLRMRFGNGFQELVQSQSFGTMGGVKYFQIVPGSRTCVGEEIVFSDSALYSHLTGLPQLVHSCSGFPYREGSDWQPVKGDLGNCGFHHLNAVRASGQPVTSDPDCVVMDDDIWHLIELEVRLNDGMRLWVDGRLTVDANQTANGTTAKGPYGRIYFSNYMTGHNSGEMAPGTWPVHYDNVIISTECLTGCGQ